MTHTEPEHKQATTKTDAALPKHAEPERNATPDKIIAGAEENTTPLQSTGRFNERASHYTHYSAIQRDMAAWLAQWLPADSDAFAAEKSELLKSTCALDLGAGDGTFTHFLTQRFAQVSALDSAPQMLCEGTLRLPQAQWLHGDAWTLEPLGDSVRTFRLITSASLLQWMQSPQETLAHWARCCPTGTRMLHGFYVEPTLCEWRTLFGQSDSLHWRDSSAWLQAFANAGWAIERAEQDVRRYRFASSMELARSLHGTGAIAHAGQLGSGRFRALLKAYDKRYDISTSTNTQPLYTFNTGPGSAGDTAHSTGVFASWGFFRVEVVRV